jgi:calpain-15
MNKNKGVWAIELFYNGRHQEVIMDDYIPCLDGSPCFTRANGNELWVIMLEKAWAKVHGSYERTAWGFPNLAMRDLTGAPSYSLPTQTEGMAQLVLDWDSQNYLMCASAQFDDATPEEMQANGLANQHAYSVIAAANLKHPLVADDTVIVCLRNPWGNFEWTGDWADDSELWTEDIKREVGFVDEDDGMFWMSFDDFIENFRRLQVCKVDDRATFTFADCYQEFGAFSLQKITVKTAGATTFTLSQCDKSGFNREKQLKYNYGNCRLILARSKDTTTKDLQYVAGTAGKPNRDLHLEVEDLQPGTYFLFSEIDWP